MPTPPRSKIVYIGIDPGQKGGIAFQSKGYLDVISMPETERDVWEQFHGLPATYGYRAVVEKVHSMPGQGVASSFKFGMGYGGIRMALVAAGIPFEEVSPQTWMKALGMGYKKDESKASFKNRLRAKAQQLFPSLPIWSEPKSKGKQLAICDALLIAEYARRKHEGIL